jgi:hypothetical protein
MIVKLCQGLGKSLSTNGCYKPQFICVNIQTLYSEHDVPDICRDRSPSISLDPGLMLTANEKTASTPRCHPSLQARSSESSYFH